MVRFLILFGCSFASVLAHDLWLVCSNYRTVAGEQARFLAINGSRFPVSEAPVAPERLAALFVLGPGGEKTEIKQTRVEEKALAFDVQFAQPGNYWVAMATRPRLIELKADDFNHYLDHDGLPHILQERQRKGIAGRDEVEQYSKYAKSYVLVGDHADEGYDRPLGLKLEIVPLKNPYSLKPGDRLPVQVLFEGLPVEGFLVQAGFEGMEGKLLENYTDSRGRAAIPLLRPGHWYLRGIQMLERQGEFRYESFWASLTFELRP